MTEHVPYVGPLRWSVCAACKEPWPCAVAEFQASQAAAATFAAELTIGRTAAAEAGLSVGGTGTSSEEKA